MFQLILITMIQKPKAFVWHPPSFIDNVGQFCHMMWTCIPGGRGCWSPLTPWSHPLWADVYCSPSDDLSWKTLLVFFESFYYWSLSVSPIYLALYIVPHACFLVGEHQNTLQCVPCVCGGGGECVCMCVYVWVCVLPLLFFRFFLIGFWWCHLHRVGSHGP